MKEEIEKALRDAEKERDEYKKAYFALKVFCEIELQWECFRLEMGLKDSTEEKTRSEKNAARLRDYLATLKI